MNAWCGRRGYRQISREEGNSACPSSLCPSHWLVSCFSTCSVPWALRRLDGQSKGSASVLLHNGLCVSQRFFSSPSFPFDFITLSWPLSSLGSSLSDSFSHGWRQRELLKRAGRQRKREGRRVRETVIVSILVHSHWNTMCFFRRIMRKI